MASMQQLSTKVKRLLHGSGALNLISRMTARGRIDIMLYHGFCEDAGCALRFPQLMPIQQFEEQIRILVRYGRPVRLDDLLRGRAQGVAITFDDGYANNYQWAFPVLRKYDFPATVFVTTGFVDRRVPLWCDWLEHLARASRLCPTSAPEGLANGALKRQLRARPIGEIHEALRELETRLGVQYDWSDLPGELQPLEWEQIRLMRRSGLVSFGSHTVSHPVLSKCIEPVQEFELAESKRRMEEELGEPCTMFAFPFGKRGDYTVATERLVRETGYRLAITAESGFNRCPARDHRGLRRWGTDMSAAEFAFLAAGGPVVSGYLKRCFG
jgi:peptidoglycan/xylan/chitin deacetylase (PgdA/CDA1 family)